MVCKPSTRIWHRRFLVKMTSTDTASAASIPRVRPNRLPHRHHRRRHRPRHRRRHRPPAVKRRVSESMSMNFRLASFARTSRRRLGTWPTRKRLKHSGPRNVNISSTVTNRETRGFAITRLAMSPQPRPFAPRRISSFAITSRLHRHRRRQMRPPRRHRRRSCLVRSLPRTRQTPQASLRLRSSTRLSTLISANSKRMQPIHSIQALPWAPKRPWGGAAWIAHASSETAPLAIRVVRNRPVDSSGGFPLGITMLFAVGIRPLRAFATMRASGLPPFLPFHRHRIRRPSRPRFSRR